MTPRRGQAAVETALVLPLSVFFVLGCLQLFLMLQARILSQYAVGRAARMGAVNFGDCNAMKKSAIAVLLPAINSKFASAADRGVAYADAVLARTPNRHLPADGSTGEVVWLERNVPPLPFGEPDWEEVWNVPELNPTLELQLVFWFPMKVPFANRVMARLTLAQWGWEYHAASPYQPVRRDANWQRMGRGPLPGSTGAGAVARELADRYDAREYVFPVVATSAARFMSPPRYSTIACR